MDELKKRTVKDFTAWDLNCPKVVVKSKGRHKLKAILKRKARRQMKRELREEK